VPSAPTDHVRRKDALAKPTTNRLGFPIKLRGQLGSGTETDATREILNDLRTYCGVEVADASKSLKLSIRRRRQMESTVKFQQCWSRLTFGPRTAAAIGPSA